jgi:hypothetical protein
MEKRLNHSTIESAVNVVPGGIGLTHLPAFGILETGAYDDQKIAGRFFYPFIFLDFVFYQ